MTIVNVDQAIYGYENGHRLLASSCPIDGPAARLLRAVTDMTFDTASESYITVLPIHDLNRQALIRSWPAVEGVRPGSVWSHALFVDFVALAHIEHFAPILRCFRRPIRDTISNQEESSYTTRLEIEMDQDSDPRMDSGSSASALLDDHSLRQLVSLVYSSEAPVSIPGDPRQTERDLFAIYEQQWPRLRRDFSFRTRSRKSANPSFQFDVEIFNKPPRLSPDEEQPEDQWVDVLAEDIHHPDPKFRASLRRFGAESRRGRKDMPGLASVLYGAIHGASEQLIARDLCESFPTPTSMRSLKRELLGSHPGSKDDFGLWARSEMDRLALLLDGRNRCFDLEDLSFADRMENLWHQSADQMASLIVDLDISSLSPTQLQFVITAAAESAPEAQIVDIAHNNTALVSHLVTARPSLSLVSNLWSIDALRADLSTSLELNPIDDQVGLLARLIDEENEDGAASVLTQAPDLIWPTLDHIGQQMPRPTDSMRELAGRAEILRRAIAKLDQETLSTVRLELQSESTLILVAALSDVFPAWRHVPAKTWGELVESTAWSGKSTKATRAVRSRLEAVALVSAQTTTPSLRKRAWLATFSDLHRALADREIDQTTWQHLQSIVPKEPDWDRCERLRRAAAKTIRKDRWISSEVQQLIDSSPEHRDKVIAAIKAEQSSSKKARHWISDLIDELLD